MDKVGELKKKRKTYFSHYENTNHPLSPGRPESAVTTSGRSSPPAPGVPSYRTRTSGTRYHVWGHTGRVVCGVKMGIQCCAGFLGERAIKSTLHHTFVPWSTLSVFSHRVTSTYSVEAGHARLPLCVISRRYCE